MRCSGAAGAAALLLAAGAACADPGYYVLSPYDREGVASAELRYWTVKAHDRGEQTWPELAFGYGVSSRWTTWLLASWIGNAGDATKPSLLAWQNMVLLTQGAWPVDVGVYLSAGRLFGDEPGHEAEYGLALQTDLGRSRLNVNLVFEREREGGTWQTPQTKWQAQWRWRRRDAAVDPGLQLFAEVGPWDHWAPRQRQSIRGGPAVFATLLGFGERPIELQAAVLWGQTYTRDGRMVSLRALLPF